MSAFFLQQTVEKLLNAYYLFVNHQEPSFVHNLLVLREQSKVDKLLDDKFKDFFEALKPFYIHARYPAYVESLKLTIELKKANQLLLLTTELKKCLEKKCKGNKPQSNKSCQKIQRVC